MYYTLCLALTKNKEKSALEVVFEYLRFSSDIYNRADKNILYIVKKDSFNESDCILVPIGYFSSAIQKLFYQDDKTFNSFHYTYITTPSIDGLYEKRYINSSEYLEMFTPDFCMFTTLYKALDTRITNVREKHYYNKHNSPSADTLNELFNYINRSNDFKLKERGFIKLYGYIVNNKNDVYTYSYILDKILEYLCDYNSKFYEFYKDKYTTFLKEISPFIEQLNNK